MNKKTQTFIEQLEENSHNLGRDQIEDVEDSLGRREAFILMCHPGTYLFIYPHDPSQRIVETLDHFAERCWPGEGSWPRDSPEYCCYEVFPDGNL